MKKRFTDSDLMQVAKRENDGKKHYQKQYVIVNKFLGKHMHVNPSTAISSFKGLAKNIKAALGDERNILVISFAETATALGAAVASELEYLLGLEGDKGCSVFYIQTTRENIKGMEYLEFASSHEHAPKQKLVSNDLGTVLKMISRIVLIDDEFTTGGTLRALIAKLVEKYPLSGSDFIAASLIDGIDFSTRKEMEDSGIVFSSLVIHDEPKESFDKIALNTTCDGIIYKTTTPDLLASREADNGTDADTGFEMKVQHEKIKGYVSARRMTDIADYKASCNILSSEVIKLLDLFEGEDMLVLGTEEFMYPALVLASAIEKCEKYCSLSINVNFHATTRSAIIPSKDEGYPLRKRYDLISLYDVRRRTYVYNLRKYDKVIILTDAKTKDNKGLDTLLGALYRCRNKDVLVVEWKS